MVDPVLYELHNDETFKNMELMSADLRSLTAACSLLHLATLFVSQIAHLLLVLMLPLH